MCEEPLTVRALGTGFGMVILRPADGATVLAGVGDAVGRNPIAASFCVPATSDVLAMVGVADALPPCGAGLPCALSVPFFTLASCLFCISTSSSLKRASRNSLC